MFILVTPGIQSKLPACEDGLCVLWLAWAPNSYVDTVEAPPLSYYRLATRALSIRNAKYFLSLIHAMGQ